MLLIDLTVVVVTRWCCLFLCGPPVGVGRPSSLRCRRPLHHVPRRQECRGQRHAQTVFSWLYRHVQHAGAGSHVICTPMPAPPVETRRQEERGNPGGHPQPASHGSQHRKNLKIPQRVDCCVGESAGKGLCAGEYNVVSPHLPLTPLLFVCCSAFVVDLLLWSTWGAKPVMMSNSLCL